jgi:hypothetical protein
LIHVKASSHPRPQPAVVLEDAMTTNEFYYLLLVLGAFGVFAVATVIASAQYTSWVRRTGRRPHAAE